MEQRTRDAGPLARARSTTQRSALKERALALWPRLDRRALRRCADDPVRIARLVARRTMLPPETIVAILGSGVTDRDRELWFG